MSEAGFGTLQDDETWKPGDPFRYPLPSDGNHWEILLEPLMEKDRAQCAAWKDELQNQLIFAGLFSSVLSAFVVQTYQTLQLDPSDQMIFLLSQIAHSISNTSSSEVSSILPPQEFLPTSNSIRINVLWLISLVLSITTVLIAIVASQWLTEHQRYPTSMPTIEKFSLFHMRQEGLINWHVPKILASVPLLLLLALVLFLVGLIDFVAGFVNTVYIPVIIVIFIPLVFIALTTSLPVIQLVITSFSTLHDSVQVPDQCPYKSTQSWALHRVLTFSNTFFLIHLLPGMLLWSFPQHIVEAFRSNSDERLFRGIPFFLKRSYQNRGQKAYKKLYEFWKSDSWITFDEKWIQFRTAYMKSKLQLAKSHWTSFTQPSVLYDCACAVNKIQTRLSIDVSRDHTADIIALYHVVEDVFTYHSSGGTGRLRASMNDLEVSILQKMIYYPEYFGWKEIFSNSFTDSRATSQVRKEETLLLFLNKYATLPAGALHSHFLELRARILKYYLDRQYEKERGVFNIAERFSLYMENPPQQNVTWSVQPIDEAIANQYSMIIKSYYKFLNDQGLNVTDFLHSHLADLNSFVSHSASIQSEAQVPSILDSLSAYLSLYTASTTVSGKVGMHSDILFFTSVYYGFSAWLHNMDFRSPSLVRLNEILTAYIRLRGHSLSDEIRMKLKLEPIPEATIIDRTMAVTHDMMSQWYFIYEGTRPLYEDSNSFLDEKHIVEISNSQPASLDGPQLRKSSNNDVPQPRLSLSMNTKEVPQQVTNSARTEK